MTKDANMQDPFHGSNLPSSSRVPGRGGQKAEHLCASIDRFQQLKSLRGPWEAKWREIAQFVLPTRDDFSQNQANRSSPGESLVFDATALMASENLAAGIYGLITNPASNWFSLTSPFPALQQEEAVQRWFRDVEDIIRQSLAASGNRFYAQVPDFFRDLAAFGTAVFYVDARKNPHSGAFDGLNFQTRPLSEIYLDQDANGQVDTIYRAFSLSARQMLKTWPQLEAPNIREMVDKGRGDQPIRLLHLVEPNTAYIRGKAGPAGKLYKSAYINLDDEQLIARSGYDELPYQVARWSLARGAVYGSSQAMLALPDIRTVNAMAKTSLLAAQKSVDPPILVPHETGMQGLKTHPGAVIVGGLDHNGRRMFEPFTLGTNVPLTLEMEEQRRTAIRDAFHAGLLLMADGPSMTATEFLGRQDEKMRLMAPYLGRIQTEFLNPLLNRVYAILARAGQIPTPPDSLVEQPGFRITYLSPLARAQKTSEANAIMRTYQTLGPLAEVAPQILQHFDFDQAARSIADAFGVPNDVLKTQEAVVREREVLIEQLVAEQQAAEGQAPQDPGAVNTSAGNQGAGSPDRPRSPAMTGQGSPASKAAADLLRGFVATGQNGLAAGPDGPTDSQSGLGEERPAGGKPDGRRGS